MFIFTSAKGCRYKTNKHVKKTISLLPHIAECALAAKALILAPLEPLHEIGVTSWKARLKRLKSLECSFMVACLQVLNASTSSVMLKTHLLAIHCVHIGGVQRVGQSGCKLCKSACERGIAEYRIRILQLVAIMSMIAHCIFKAALSPCGMVV